MNDDAKEFGRNRRELLVTTLRVLYRKCNCIVTLYKGSDKGGNVPFAKKDKERSPFTCQK